jgi:hypothetical protein
MSYRHGISRPSAYGLLGAFGLLDVQPQILFEINGLMAVYGDRHPRTI